MNHTGQITISCIPEISAIYYALLQCGYEYYSIERSMDHNDALQSFTDEKYSSSFFSGTRQDTCEVYPYWPRAAILETASFHLSSDHSQFQSYDAFHKDIMSSGNIADHERDQKLWNWIDNFPTAISKVFASDPFHRYLEWEKKWLEVLNIQHQEELQVIQSCLSVCVSKYGSPVQDIQIVINPIKCVYSADYHLEGNCFIFISGALNANSVIHEFLHHVIRPFVDKITTFVLANRRIYPDIDDSYYLEGDDEGQINAFEEHAVRQLTKDILDRRYPDNLEIYLKGLA